KLDDTVKGKDQHDVYYTDNSGKHSSTQEMEFKGTIFGNCSGNVRINSKAAATVGSKAKNSTDHTVTAPATNFEHPPSNEGTISEGTNQVKINGKGAAYDGSHATTCNDKGQTNNSSVEVSGANVFVGV